MFFMRFLLVLVYSFLLFFLVFIVLYGFGAVYHHPFDCSFGYLLLIPPKSTSGEWNTAAGIAIVIFRVNVMTFFVTQ